MSDGLQYIQNPKIIKNAAQCKLCGDILVSEHRHDFKTCSCGEICVDGGRSYIKRGYRTSSDNIIDLSEYEEVKG